MDSELRKPVYALATLFGLLLLLIFIFMQTGDMSQTLSLPPVQEPVTSSVIAPAIKTAPASGYRKFSPPPNQAPHENNELQQGGFKDSTKQKKDSSSATCNFEDGTHKAIAEFSDPETGYSATYKLDVTVLNCQVIAIDIPRLGWLDADHFKAADIDENGDASFEDDKGRIFYIHVKG